MSPFQRINYSDKKEFYRELATEIEGMLVKTWFTNLANLSAALMAHLPDINWVGFYLSSGSELHLGPFQGLPACLTIPLGKGVCGTAALERRTMLIENVDQFPGHIACDTRSRSELVIPLVLPNTGLTTPPDTASGRLLGVLDIDSPTLKRFCEKDRIGLESLLGPLLTKSHWPSKFI